MWHLHSIFISWEEHPGSPSDCGASMPDPPPLSATMRASFRCKQGGRCLHFAKLPATDAWLIKPSVAVSLQSLKILKMRRRVKGVKALKFLGFRNILCPGPKEGRPDQIIFVMNYSRCRHSPCIVLSRFIAPPSVTEITSPYISTFWTFFCRDSAILP
jgi:hypothetical protein